MTRPPAGDPFGHDDAVYLLGALSAPERQAYEEHLRSCAECSASVHEVSGVPALLAGVTAADVADALEEGPPETLLPGLLGRASARRRRRRRLTGALVAAAAACLIAVAALAWPFGTSGRGSPAPRAFVAVQATPVHADAALVETSWGTRIEVHCSYAAGAGGAWPYRLRVLDTAGDSDDLGSWQLSPGRDITFTAVTALHPDQIVEVQIALLDGTPILRLSN